jgi:NHLM bacteriocin system ABC transporter peptidase/ATP-binding protein
MNKPTGSQERKRLWQNKRVNVPTVLQMEAVECGVASLAMILAYYGRFVSLEQLRVECGVSRDGSKAGNLLKAARKYGLQAQGYKKEKPEEVRQFPLPQIVFWNFNHFLVLAGIKGNRVFLNDPMIGPREIPLEEFDQSFTGVILTFEPGPTFERGGIKFNILPALLKRLAELKTALLYVALAGLFLVIPGLVIPTFSKIFVDNILVGRMYGWAKPLLVGMAATALLRGALTYAQRHYLLRLETRLAVSWSARFFRHVFCLPVQFFFQRHAGDVASRVTLNDSVAKLLSGELATNLVNVVMIGFYAFLLFQYDLLLASLGVAIALLNLLFLRYVSRKRVDLNQKLQQEEGNFMGASMGGLQIIETLKATGAENDFFAIWSGYQAKVLNAQQELGVSTNLLMAVPPFLSAINTAAILIGGGLRVMDGHLSLGALVAFQSLMASFIAPINEMVNLGAKIQELTGGIKRLDDVFQHEPERQFISAPPKGVEHAATEDRAQPDEAEFGKLQGYLELKNISFGYSLLEPPLIKNFSLTLKPGAKVALVGGSGSGKSTLAKLISGLYEPWEGEILYDGAPRRAYPRRVLTNSVAVVDQEIFLFEGAVRENLTLWDQTVPDAQMSAAAKDACIHDDIGLRPGGYNSLVEEGGRNFSGGQRQRLEIARALVTNPRILILDEATSALDTKTEKQFNDNMRRRGCTTIIIAHRLSTIRDADEIIILERGKVVQRGAHEEMIKNPDSPYAKLIQTN